MKFNIHVFNKLGSKFYITQFDPTIEQQNLYSTFDEKISHEDNDQVTLTFSLSGVVPNEKGELIQNPYLKYLMLGSQICLETENNYYELIIKQIAPQLSRKGTVYNFTCQDEISYKWSRINLGYSYDTMERGGVKTLFDIAREILLDCGISKKWLVKENNNHLYPNSNLKTEKITLQVENSNPYNVLIEGLNALNASMLVNYRNHEIRFYQKNRVLFSGYRYRPEINLRSLSATYGIDELTTVMHVTGGTDEKDMNIMLVPPIPDAVKNYLEDTAYVVPQDKYANILDYESYNQFPLSKYIKKEINQYGGGTDLNVEFSNEGIRATGVGKINDDGCARFVFTNERTIPVQLQPGCYYAKMSTIAQNSDSIPQGHIAIGPKDKNTYYYNSSFNNIGAYFNAPQTTDTMDLDMCFKINQENKYLDAWFKPQILAKYIYLLDSERFGLYNKSSSANATSIFYPADTSTIGVSPGSAKHNRIEVTSNGLKQNSDKYKYATVFDTGGNRINLHLKKGEYKLYLNCQVNDVKDPIKGVMGIQFFNKNGVQVSSYSEIGSNSGFNFTLSEDCDKVYLQLRLQNTTNDSEITGLKTENGLISFMPYIEPVYEESIINTLYEIPTSKLNYLFALADDNLINVNTYAADAQQKEKQEVVDFCIIADKVPSLGQFIYNFDFFLQNGLMTHEQYNTIKNIFDVQMRNINIKLKPLLLTYYNTMWNMQKKLVDARSKIEQINAIYASIMNGDSITGFRSEVDEHKNDIKLLLGAEFKNYYYSLYGKHLYLQTGKYIPEIQNILDEIDMYIQMREESKYYYFLYQEKYKKQDEGGKYFEGTSVDPVTKDDYDKAQLQGDILYYKDRYYYALQMCGHVKNAEEFVNSYKDSTIFNKHKYEPAKSIDLSNNCNAMAAVDCYFAILWDNFVRKLDNNIHSTNKTYGINGMIEDLETQINMLWDQLYTNYSQFIYESTYENTDELDSVSLYNQAISYFESYHHPKSDYSVDVINLDDLEQIGIPNLKVNSRIRIYNEDLGLDEGTSYDGKAGTKLNNISYTTNELLITGLNYSLRNSATASITVERIIQHQNILQKLIKNIR